MTQGGPRLHYTELLGSPKGALECSRQATQNSSMSARAAGHHHDMALIQLVPLVAFLHPGEERGFVHPQVGLDIHGCLITGILVGAGERRKATFGFFAV